MLLVHTNNFGRDTSLDFYEKTRPTQLSHFVADDEKQMKRLELLTTNKLSFPNQAKKSIILHGRYGTGKTELAKLLPRMIEEHRVENLSEHEKNSAFDTLPIQIFHSCSVDAPSKAIEVAKLTIVSLNPSKMHYVILDEFDNLKADYQRSLKSFISEYSHVIHIMTTNHLGKIDAGLRSRSHLISFENPSVELWLKRCIEICQMYEVAPDERYLKDLIRRNRCDARNIMSELEEHIKLSN